MLLLKNKQKKDNGFLLQYSATEVKELSNNKRNKSIPLLNPGRKFVHDLHGSVRL